MGNGKWGTNMFIWRRGGRVQFSFGRGSVPFPTSRTVLVKRVQIVDSNGLQDITRTRTWEMRINEHPHPPPLLDAYHIRPHVISSRTACVPSERDWPAYAESIRTCVHRFPCSRSCSVRERAACGASEWCRARSGSATHSNSDFLRAVL